MVWRRVGEGVVRKISADEADAFVAHLLRLTPDDRRLRFGNGVGPLFLASYGQRRGGPADVRLGYFADGCLRGAGELVLCREERRRTAEIALSVEQAWQGRGIGSELLRCCVMLARNRMIARLRICCLPENRRMQALMRKAGAVVRFDGAMMEGRIETSWPTYMTMTEEMWGDSYAALHRLFDGGRGGGPRPLASASL
jgi:RimJ/RimL family protein N-acetyltransferase